VQFQKKGLKKLQTEINIENIVSPPKAKEILRCASKGYDDLIAFAEFISPYFKTTWHQEVMAWYLEKIERGEIKRLAILLPSRHGKSEVTSIHFPAWYLGRNPKKTILLLSYSNTLPSEFGGKARDIMQSFYYSLVFNTKLNQSSVARDRWKTKEGGGYIGHGREGSVTGQGGDLLIGDDLISGEKEASSLYIRDKTWDWWRGTARDRLNSNGSIILANTRWHEDDVIGRIFEQGRMEGKEEDEKKLSASNWTVVNMPALAEEDEVWMDGEHTRLKGQALYPDKYNEQELYEIWADIGDKFFYTKFQQDPSHESTAQVPRALWKTYKKEEVEPQNIITKINSYDTAETKLKSSAYTGKTTWGKLRGDQQRVALLGAYKKKMEFTELVEQIKKDYIEDRPNEIVIEERSNGRALLQIFRHTVRIGDKMLKLPTVSFNEWCKRNKIPSNLSKQERIDMTLPHVTHGEVLVPEEDSEWKSMFLKEWVAMSDASMDVIDSSTQAIIYLKGKRRIELW